MTSFLCSVLLNVCEIWVHTHLASTLNLEVRLILFKSHNHVWKEPIRCGDLNQISERAKPDEWSDFAEVDQLINIAKIGQPR